MIDFLESIDRQLLLLINGWNSPFFDEVMWIVSGKLTWVPLYALLLFLMIRKAPRQWWVLIIGIAAAVTLADTISETVKAAPSSRQTLRKAASPNPAIGARAA